MTEIWLTPDNVFDGGEMRGDVSVRIEDGHVAELSNARHEGLRVAGCLTPGFVDLQVNGGGGVQLNDDPTADAMTAVADAHRRFGTMAILPTVITDRAEVLQQAAEAAIKAKGRRGIAGLHIEGPHISMKRRGTHSPVHVRPMEAATQEVVARLRGAGVPVMITVAPEAVDAAQIAALAETGAIVSIGHTDAPAKDIEAAIAAGACCGTHLFNAMSPMTSREPGAVGAILNAGVSFGIICDGHHVDDRMVRLALRASQAPELAFLVSDAMATVGGPDHFELYGQRVELRDGRLVNAEGSLAGAHVTQAEGVERLVNVVGISLPAALQMAVSTPAALMDQPELSALMGRPAEDLLLLSGTGHVLGTLSERLQKKGAVNAAE